VKRENYTQAITERFSVLRELNDFDRAFWASQSDRVKFAAVHNMLLDYLLITTGKRDEPRLDRTVESFQRVSFYLEKLRATDLKKQS
jgi:hypothetical protein